MTNHPNRSAAAKQITLQIATEDTQGRVTFSSVGSAYASRAKAMSAAKKLAGRGASYCGDGLSIRYAGPHGTVYLVEPR
jgi:hypothetical protein